MTDIQQVINQNQRESDINEVRSLFDPFEKPDSLDMSDEDYSKAHKCLRRELREIEDNSLMRKILREEAMGTREKDADFLKAIAFTSAEITIEQASQILKEAVA